MKFVKLNEEWNADPNFPNPQVDIIQNNIVLSFQMNSFQYDGYKEGDIGFILFKDVFWYRLGSPNDESFFRGQFRYDSSQVRWGNLYEVNESITNIPSESITVNENYKFNNRSRYYLFFFRDNTFECIANEYTLFVDKKMEAYCPYCAKRLVYNGRNLKGINCSGEYSIKMSQCILINKELAELKEYNKSKIKESGKIYCPNCSSRLYHIKSNGLLCIECGFKFSRNEYYHLIELNPHM